MGRDGESEGLGRVEREESEAVKRAWHGVESYKD